MGLIHPDSIPALEQFNSAFGPISTPPFDISNDNRVFGFSPEYSTLEQRTKVMRQAMLQLKEQKAWETLESKSIAILYSF